MPVNMVKNKYNRSIGLLPESTISVSLLFELVYD